MAIARNHGCLWMAAALAIAGCNATIDQPQDEVTGKSAALTWTDGSLTVTVEADVEPIRCEGVDPTLGVSGSISIAGTGSFTAVAMITNVDTGTVSLVTLASATDFVTVGSDRVASFMTDVLLPNGMHSVELCFGLTTARGLSRTTACLPAFDYDVDCNMPVDITPPTIVGSRTPAANAAGWNNTDVTASFVCEDLESGIASCTAPVTLSAEGAGQSVTGTAVDIAGNMAMATVSDINIDKTAPSIAFLGARDYLVDEMVAVSCEFDDALSGVASSTCNGATGAAYTFGLGEHSVSGSATDNADNMSSASATFTVSVTPDSLCNVVDTLVDKHSIVKSLCAKLRAIDWAMGHGHGHDYLWLSKALIYAFKLEVRALTGRGISAANAAILRDLADGLMPD